jgi:hypothetical protein
MSAKMYVTGLQTGDVRTQNGVIVPRLVLILQLLYSNYIDVTGLQTGDMRAQDGVVASLNLIVIGLWMWPVTVSAYPVEM